MDDGGEPERALAAGRHYRMKHSRQQGQVTGLPVRDGLQAYGRTGVLPAVLCGVLPAAPRGQEPERRKPAVPAGRKRRPPCVVRHASPGRTRNSRASDAFAAYRKACREVEGRARPLGDRHRTTVEPDGVIASWMGICRIRPSVPAEHVDHRHDTGRVRDVPCFSRDAGLGQSRDRPDVERRAAAYVEGNVWKPTLVAPGVYLLPS